MKKMNQHGTIFIAYCTAHLSHYGGKETKHRRNNIMENCDLLQIT